MLALTAEGGSVTTPAPAALPDSRQQDRARGGPLELLKWKRCQTQGQKRRWVSVWAYAAILGHLSGANKLRMYTEI